MNIALLVVVGLVFWHLFSRKGDGLPASSSTVENIAKPVPGPLPEQHPTTDPNGAVAGDVQTSTATP